MKRYHFFWIGNVLLSFLFQVWLRLFVQRLVSNSYDCLITYLCFDFSVMSPCSQLSELRWASTRLKL